MPRRLSTELERILCCLLGFFIGPQTIKPLSFCIESRCFRTTVTVLILWDGCRPSSRSA